MRQALMPELTAAYRELPAEIVLVEPETLGLLWLNQRATATLGYDLGATPDLKLNEIISGADAQQFLANAKTSTGRLTQECELTSAAGVERRVELQLTPLVHSGTKVLVLFANDLSTTDRLANELNTAQVYFESAPDPTLIVDGLGTILTANAQVESLLGYHRSELVGQKIERLIPQRYASAHQGHRQRYTEAPVIRGMGAELTLFALTKNGREVPIEVSLSPIESEGKTLVAAALRDMTERKAAEQALRNSEESLREARDDAEAANLSKSRFLAAASHDLRQPLQAIRLYLSVLTRRTEEPKAQEVIDKMESSVDTMSELLDALLDISRLNSGAIVPSRSNFSSQALLENIVASNLEQARQKGLTLRCEPDNFSVHSDAGLLARIVDNFVTNAIRYTQAGQITLSAEQQDNRVILSVADTGIGIEADKIDRVFEEYFQLDNTVRDRKKGLGLGLSIVRHIATLLDHKIDVTSVVNEGSVFSVTVPAADADQEPNALKAHSGDVQQQQKTKTVHVLLVDDDEAIVDATTMLLEEANVNVSVAYSGEEAIEKLNKKPRLDLLITDYRLPGKNGAEVVEHARGSYGDKLPAILMSGDTSITELSENRLANCEFLRKPVNTDTLIKLIDNLVR